MSKGRYRTVEVKQVDWAAWAIQASGGTVVLAVDVAKEDFVGRVDLRDGVHLGRVKWRHPEQTGELLAGIKGLAAVARVEAVMESSGTYGDALRWQLQCLGAQIFRASAKRVHDAAEVYDGVPSLHDAKAADIIAELHRQGHTQAWPEHDTARRALNAQLQMLYQCKTLYQQQSNRLEALLARHWPEALAILGLESATLHHLIADFGGPAQVHGLEGPARALMHKTGRHWLAEEKIEAVLRSAGTTLGLPCVLEERQLLRWQAKRLLETAAEVRRLEQLVEGAVAAAPLLTTMAPVVGPVTSAVLLAALGNPQDYPDPASYCKAFGLNLKERSSGKHKGHLKITKRGPSVARYYLYFAALRLIANEPIVARWFQTKTTRPGAMAGKQVVELMRRLAKALWHLAHGRAFQVARLFDQHAVASA
ncbi:transposase [uncultured Lamprocystis sp.]|jgi:transposase|uniref:transposase n=1 Tax=uncultured Lamprocystis sp. TaxID=543132 RepID=UPI0025F75752|nr:transposase [uncultured Lamprocystis sp.]